MLSLHTTILWNSLNPGRVSGNLSTHLYRAVLCLTLPFPHRSPNVGLVSVIVRWQNKYWYFPTNTKIRRLGTLLKGSALAQPVPSRGFQTQHLKTKKKPRKCSGFFRLFLFFRASALSKPACRWAAQVQHQPAAQVVRGHNSQPRRAPRSCAPCRRGPRVPAT